MGNHGRLITNLRLPMIAYVSLFASVSMRLCVCACVRVRAKHVQVCGMFVSVCAIRCVMDVFYASAFVKYLLDKASLGLDYLRLRVM